MSWLLVGLGLVTAALMIAVSLQPKDFRIRAGERLPEMARGRPGKGSTPRYDGPAAGTGSQYAWVGNKNVGEGRMTIVDRRPGELVRIKLEFFKPFVATNTAEFRFKPADGATAVKDVVERHG